MAISRYWRLVGICTPGNGALELSEARIYENGVIADVGATLSCTVAPDSGSMTDLRDDLTTGVVSWGYAKYSQPGFALMWDFGVAGGVEFPSLRFGSGNSAATYPLDLIVQLSTNAREWLLYGSLIVDAIFPGANSLTFTPAAGQGDAYFNYVTFALHMDGADSSTAFIDIKGNTFTGAGNAKISTTQSKFGGASAYFDGTGDYITSPARLKQMAFTVEAWVMVNTAKEQAIFSQYDSTDGRTSLYLNASGKLEFFIGSSTLGNLLIADPVIFNALTWVHVCVQRNNGNVVTLYKDGVAVATGSSSQPLFNGPCSIGGQFSTIFNLQRPFEGYIDDLRVTDGAARYTGNFAPPTTPFAETFDLLPAYGGIRIDDPYFESVVLAMHMDGANGSTTFTDLKGKTVTRYGNTVISTTQSKFGGASAYFDGNYDYLSLANSRDFDISGDFTIACFVYHLARPTTDWHQIVGNIDDAGTGGWRLLVGNTGQVHFNFYRTSGASDGASTSSGEIPLNAWMHLEVTSQNGLGYIFVNGVLKTGGFSTPNIDTSTQPLYIGSTTASAWFFNGYISELIVTKGVARHTTGFTPPTKPFSNTNYSAYAGAAPSRTRQLAPLPERLLPATELPATTVHGHLREFPFFDVYNGGLGLIAGTVKEKALPANTPLHRKVWLMDEASGMVIRETWSDATTGDYEFRGVKQGVKYTVLAYDYTGQYRAVIADAQIPELIP